MKVRPLHIALFSAVLAIGVIYLLFSPAPQRENVGVSEPRPQTNISVKPTKKIQSVPPAQKPEQKVAPETAPVPAPDKQPPKPKPRLTDEQRMQQYWQQMNARFARQQEQLNAETDPAKRMNLIRQMGRFVRVDTVAALDWASTLHNPDEQQAALESINQNALVGIGARIEQDESGLPVIRETTILSAAAAAGVESGDHISGVVNADGSVIDFQDVPLREVVQHLRGKPGTEITLIIGKNGEMFEVSVPRSMIVVPP